MLWGATGRVVYGAMGKLMIYLVHIRGEGNEMGTGGAARAIGRVVRGSGTNHSYGSTRGKIQLEFGTQLVSTSWLPRCTI